MKTEDKLNIQAARLLGEFIGVLEGVCLWEIPEELKLRLQTKLTALSKVKIISSDLEESANNQQSNGVLPCVMVRYKCATCGNTCLQDTKPDNSVCGGCDNPNWKIMKTQEAYMVNQESWVHPIGEI